MLKELKEGRENLKGYVDMFVEWINDEHEDEII